MLIGDPIGDPPAAAHASRAIRTDDGACGVELRPGRRTDRTLLWHQTTVQVQASAAPLADEERELLRELVMFWRPFRDRADLLVVDDEGATLYEETFGV